jgi:lichenan operon transcriptional antiterminator
MLNRLLFGLRLKNPLLVDVKRKYPVAYKMAEIAGQVIESKFDMKVSEDELGYLAFYFGVFITLSDDKVKRFQKVAVLCGTGRGTARLIAMQLERIFKQETKIDLYSDLDVTEDTLNHYDLIFSTVKLSYETTKPLIMINEIFDENTVKKEIEKTLYKQKSNVKRDNVYLSVIAELISEEKFFILDHTKGYHENVNSMVHSLIKSGYLDSGFTERLKERETKGSMVFDNYVALPHTFNQLSNQIELALGIFPETVVADGKELKLVFLLGLPEQQTDNNEYLIVKIYDEIIRIANDKQLIEKMSIAENYSDIIQLLESGL